MENIGRVKLNLKFYKGEDIYSDGDIEDTILKIVKENKNYEHILANENRYPIVYHLSPIRENVLEWYNFETNAEVLEVGAGCGAITGILSEKCKNVTCVELSKRRALINAYRNKEKDNVEIIVGNLNDLIFNKKFDYITLIGVLEYARLFTEGQDPFKDFLKKIRTFLKPGGKIIIAIENKFGLKYWAGCREDHNSEFFSGLEDYSSGNKVETFSKSELEKLLLNSDYKGLKFYYPLPDYKFPMQIFSEKKLPQNVDLDFISPNYDQDRIKLFQEDKVFANLIKNNQFEFFANSFIVIAKG